MPNWVYEIKSMRILDVNDSAIAHYGYSKEEFLSMTIRELRPEEEIPKLVHAHSNISEKSGTIRFGKFKHQKKNGEIITVEVYGHKVMFRGLEAIMVTCLDISATEKHLAELEISQQRLQEAATIAKLGYWTTDLITNEFTWSEEVYRIWEVDPDTFVPDFDSFFESIHQEDRAEFQILQPKAISGHLPLDFVHRIYTPSGKIKWVHEKGRVKINDSGIATQFYGTVQDITAQKVEEQHLKLLESVIIHTDDIVLITEAEPQDDPGPRIIYVNEAFTRLTGYSIEEVMGKTPRILQGPKTDQKELAKLKKALKNWQSCEITTINYKKNGEEYWVNMSISPVANEKGWFTHWIAIERDVTEEKNKQLRKELQSKISLLFGQKGDLQSALNRLCDQISDFGDLTLCEVWVPDILRKNLRLLGKSTRLESSKVFYSADDQIEELPIAVGLPGQILANPSQHFWDHPSIQSSFFRKQSAKLIDLKSAFGFPLVHHQELVGVMIVGSSREQAGILQLKPLFTQLETFLGAEIHRKRLENDLSHFFEALPDLVCLMDFEGNFLKVNQAGCELLGYSEKELVGSFFGHYILEDDWDAAVAKYSKIMKTGGRILKFENRVKTKSGEIIWLNWHGNAIMEDKLIYATAKNITKEKKLRQIADSASELALIGGWEMDLRNQESGDAMYWSPMVKKILELDQAYNPSLSGGFEFYTPESYGKITAAVNLLIEKGKAFDEELLIKTAKGNFRWIRCIGEGEFVDGKCSRIFGSYQDIHERKSLDLRMNEILESISDSFYAMDAHWNFTFFNREAEILLQKKKDEVLGKSFWDVLPAVKGTELETSYRRVLQTGQSESLEYLYPGDGCWYEINVYAAQNGLSVYFKNIDERKRVAEELRKSYLERNEILESIGDAFFAVDNDWIVTYWNHMAEKVLFKTKDQILGKYLWTEYSDAIDSDFYRMYHLAKESSEIVSFEEHYPTLGKWFEVTAYPSAKGLSVYFKDITLRKATDLIIQEANERFERVTEATTDAIWDWDIAKDVFYRGNGFEKLFGYEPQKIMHSGDFWKESFHPEDLPLLQKSVEDALNSPSIHRWELEYRILHQSGYTKTVLDKGIIIRDEHGTPTRMVGAITDITYRKEH